MLTDGDLIKEELCEFEADLNRHLVSELSRSVE